MKLLILSCSVGMLIAAGCGSSPEVPPERPYAATEVSCKDMWPDPEANVDVDVLPEVIIQPKPEYPEVLKNQGVEATVMVKVLVDCNGEVGDMILAESSNYQRLDDNAMEAAAQMEFRPAVRDGKPVPVWVVYPFAYRVEGK